VTPKGKAELGSGSTEDYLVEWLSHARGRIRARTYQGYEGLIRLYALPSIGELPLKDVHPLHLQSLYASLMNDRIPPISAGTVLNLHLVLTQAFGQAVRWGLIDRSPAAGAQPPRPRRPEPAVVDAELTTRILQAARGQAIELPVAIAIATGMRRGEVLGLRWRDLDPDFSVAHVRRTLQSTAPEPRFEDPKTRRSRRAVALPRFLHPYLTNQREDQARRRGELGERWQDTDLIVDAGDGGAVSPVNFSSAWPRFLQRSGLPHVRFHDLRHGHATLMLIQGVHPKVVSERLGHSSIGITLDTYSHVLPGMQAEAAQAFDTLFPTG
jgi:integrase